MFFCVHKMTEPRTVGTIRTLDPDSPESVEMQVAQLQKFFMRIVPGILTDTARQAKLLANAKWAEERFPTPEDADRAVPSPDAMRAAAKDALATRKALLINRMSFCRNVIMFNRADAAGKNVLKPRTTTPTAIPGPAEAPPQKRVKCGKTRK